MDKKNIFILTGLLLFLGFSTMILSADSCEGYSADVKKICSSVADAKNDFYKKYMMSASNSTQNLGVSSCSGLSGVEKDACTTKNNFVSQHSLTSSSSTPPKTQGTYLPPAASSAVQRPEVTTQVEEQLPASTPPTTNNGNIRGKVNIFNN